MKSMAPCLRRGGWLSLACVVLLAAALPAPANGPYQKGTAKTDDLIDFTVSIVPPDPFSDANRPGATPAPVRRGEVFTLLIRGVPKKGFHTYPVTMRADSEDQKENSLTRIVYDRSEAFRPLQPILESTPDWDKDERLGQVQLVHEKPFHWMQDILVQADATPGKHTLAFTLEGFQVCDENKCTRGKPHFEVPLTVTSNPAVTVPPEVQKRFDPPKAGDHFPGESPLQDWSRASKAGIVAVPIPPEMRPEKQISAGTGSASSGGKTGLLALILTSIIAAAAMLFTPCVFPMIPITVSFFLKQSEKEHYNPLATALVYSITIIVVLVLAVLVLGQIIVELANSPWLNLGLGVLLVVFALSLFGMYELELPHFLSRFTSAREGQGGYGGALFMALTFTVTSFTCTGPFLGPLLVATKEMQLTFMERVVGATAYATTFAAPFFLLALFPAALKALPRSGGWLNVVKVVMGFLELAMAFKFLGNMDVTLTSGDPVLFSYEFVFASWIALSLGCGLYLLGLFRLPHDTPVEHVSVSRFLLASLFLSLGVYMAPALWHKTPQGVLGRFLVSFAPLDQSRQEDVELDYEKARARALAENKLLFIDFTGVNCQNCRANEVGPFRRPEVKKLLDQFVVVQLYNDTVPKPGLSSEEADKEAQRNADWQQNTFGESSTPLYVIFRPDPGALEEDGKLKGQVVARTKGYISDVPAFEAMLKKALGR
jgi:thiol:disulfide interchange protein DsbD